MWLRRCRAQPTRKNRTLHRSRWHTAKMTDTLTVISAECEARLSESKPIYYWLRQSDRQMDTLMHEDRWKEERKLGSGAEGEGKKNSKRRWTDKAKTERGEKMMHVGGQTGAFPPRLVASIWSVELHTHTHIHTRALNLHMETEIGLLIVLRQRDLKGRQRCLCVETCLQIVTANRKTIGDLNSQWSSQPSPQRLRYERTPIVSW